MSKKTCLAEAIRHLNLKQFAIIINLSTRASFAKVVLSLHLAIIIYPSHFIPFLLYFMYIFQH